MNNFSSISTDQLIKEAECNEMNKRFNQAINLYETAIASNKTFFSAYYSLGALHEKLNNMSKAKDVYKMGISTAKQIQNKTIETELSFTLLGLID